MKGVTESEWGVPEWQAEKRGDRLVSASRNPFEERLRHDKAFLGPIRDAAIDVHDSLRVAREIAISIYGRQWADFVLAVYDRLLTKEAQKEEVFNEQLEMVAEAKASTWRAEDPVLRCGERFSEQEAQREGERAGSCNAPATHLVETPDGGTSPLCHKHAQNWAPRLVTEIGT